MTGRIKDGIAITGAGNLPCNHVIHLNAPTSLGQWRKRIHHALIEADSKGIESVAFPAQGTGNNEIVGIQNISQSTLTTVNQSALSQSQPNLSQSTRFPHQPIINFYSQTITSHNSLPVNCLPTSKQLPICSQSASKQYTT